MKIHLYCAAHPDPEEEASMKFFVDTADLEEIRQLAELGLLDGVTTNPSLVAKSGRNFLDTVREICEVVEGPVSAEVAATDFETMLAEGRKLAGIAPNVAVKVPLTPAGLRTCSQLVRDGVMVNVTLCFSPAQALLAAKAGATFVSPFAGRLDDIGSDGLRLIADIVAMYGNYPGVETQVLAASLRSPQHVVDSAMAGADVATVPPAVLHQMFKHPLTDSGLERFVRDWEATGQKIL
jgi:transaldolase